MEPTEEASAYAPQTQEPAPKPRFAGRFRRRFRRNWVLAVAVLGVFATTFALGVVLRRWFVEAVSVSCAGMILSIAAAALVAAGGLIHHLFSWRRPLRELEHLIADIQAGEEPLEKLQQTTGPLQVLAEAVWSILHNLRQQRYEIARIELEISQRVAQRTEAQERRYNSLHNQASRDSLTGLFNRRWYDHHLPQVFEDAKSERSDLCLLMLDLDNFKFLNDTLGHAAGDELLRGVGQIVRSTIRPVDLAFRCGGDELVVVLPGVGAAAGRVVARRLADLIDAMGRQLRLKYPPGCSLGMASMAELRQQTLAELLALADKRLYECKGRRKFSRAPRTPTQAA